MFYRQLIVGLLCLLGIAVKAQYTIPDPAFAAKLQQIVPNAMSGNVLDENHPDVTSLTFMNASYANISDLDGIQFFTGLQQLSCYNNQLTDLPTLPPSLLGLHCHSNQLTSIPTLPVTLEVLLCMNNQLTSLPSLLGSSLRSLDCGNNQLTSLPSLPGDLIHLTVDNNMLTTLPPLGDLHHLDCSVNQLTSLPPLPTPNPSSSGLTTLDCSYNQLSTLPTLPQHLFSLDCSYNPGIIIPTLPNGLTMLTCKSNSLTSLPALPGSLTDLDCRNNDLTALPTLPSSLRELYCMINQLGTLPSLPASLIRLECQNNSLTSLPPMPPSMWLLDFSDNQIATIPPLNNSLQWLHFTDNSVSVIPELPDSLINLHCNGNPVQCLPELPDNLSFLRSSNTLISCLPNVPPSLATSSDFTNANVGFAPVLCSTSDPCFPSEAITGIIFLDANGNGTQDGGEQPFLNGVAEAQPGSYLSGVDVNGRYGIPIQPGSYTVQGQPVLYHTITTPAHNVSIVAGSSDTGNDIGYQIISGIYDLVAQVTASATRPGFDNVVGLQIKNIGTEATTANISLDFDAVQNWVGASVAPSSQSGSNATWSVAMSPGDCWSASITLNTPASVALGTPIQHQGTATPSSADNTPADNTDTWNAVVVGSYDPNDKLSSVSSLTESEVQSGAWIDYTIRFQNTGTFLAENVLITDTLPEELQAGTFTYVASSHSNFWYLEDGVLHVRYDGIQLPDSNANEPASHGYVKFRIMASTSLINGDDITNTANIYFDFNEPVITDPNVITIGPEEILLNARMLLGGCYEQGTGLMRDDLRTAQLIPNNEPYTALGYMPTGPQPSSMIDAGVLSVSGNNAIVDWVIVELRSSNNNAQIVASRYGLIQRDGDIVDLDGTSALEFPAPAGNYYVAFRHRNHLGVLSGLQYMIGMTPTSVDLTYPQTPAYGTQARQNVNGTMVMWAGNVNFNDELKYTGLHNDRDPILVEIGGSIPTNITNGYRSEDVTMDGLIQYTGLGNDRDPILVNIGGVVPTHIRQEQLP